MSSTNPIGFPFIELLTVESTNNYAMGLVHAGMAQHGTAVFTHHQTKGKGQREKQWLSAPDKNITLSVIVKPFELMVSQQFCLAMSVAIGVQNFFKRYAGDETKIKWPNDIYWRDRKAGGILIENILQGNEWKFSVIGVGLNLNQTSFDEFQNKAVSLKQITGKTYDTVEMAKELLTNLNVSLQKLTDNSDALISDYQERLYKWNEKTTLKNGNRVFEALIKGVDRNGYLITEHEREEFFKVGEVEWVTK